MRVKFGGESRVNSKFLSFTELFSLTLVWLLFMLLQEESAAVE